MFYSFPEIEGFHQVRRSVEKYPELLRGRPAVIYRPKVKLHGTNAGVLVQSKRLGAQSRERIITPGDDNMGFAAWLEANTSRFLGGLGDVPHAGRDCVIYGEWCGPGIMKGVAINKAPRKQFAVFAAVIVNDHGEATDEWIVEPSELEDMIADAAGPHDDIFIVPWDGPSISIDVLAPSEDLALTMEAINARVAEVEAEDPLVKLMYDVSGVGEGLVYYPTGPHAGRENFKNLAFKAKGDKHKTVSRAQPAQVDPVVAAGASDFATVVLTVARLEQGARAVNGGEFMCEMRLIGPFLAWVNKDVQKECEAELEASKLTWKQVQKALSDTARGWYVSKAKAV